MAFNFNSLLTDGVLLLKNAEDGIRWDDIYIAEPLL